MASKGLSLYIAGVASRGVLLGISVMLLSAGCGGGGSDADPSTTVATVASTTSTASTTTTAPERPTSTTTTTYDPASVEGEVEAAYLKSWDVYADAVYNLRLDEAALAEVYTGKHLDTKRTEIERRIADGRSAAVQVEHRYDVILINQNQAQVVDRFVNHQVLIDPETKEPVEDDPNELLVFNFRLDQSDGAWRVSFIQRVQT